MNNKRIYFIIAIIAYIYVIYLWISNYNEEKIYKDRFVKTVATINASKWHWKNWANLDITYECRWIKFINKNVRFSEWVFENRYKIWDKVSVYCANDIVYDEDDFKDNWALSIIIYSIVWIIIIVWANK